MRLMQLFDVLCVCVCYACVYVYVCMCVLCVCSDVMDPCFKQLSDIFAKYVWGVLFCCACAHHSDNIIETCATHHIILYMYMYISYNM